MNELTNLFAQFSVQPFLNHTQTLIVLIDSGGQLLEWNPAFGQLKESNPGVATIQDFFATSSQSFFTEMMLAKEPRQASLELSSDSGEADFKCLLAPVAGGNFVFCAEPARESKDEKLARLMSELKKTKHALEIKKIDLESVLEQSKEISNTDSLTFLPNRRQLITDLQHLVALSDRQRKPLTIFILDIDHFKQVNDSFGHAAGDRVLQTLAGRLLESVREVDEAGRYGGDEFIILLPGTTEKTARIIADRLLGLVRGLEIDIDEKVLKITISIGIAEYRIGEESWEDLFKRADRALYQSKENGRDRWTISDFS